MQRFLRSSPTNWWLFNHIRYCSVKTELIDGDDHLDEELNIVRTSVSVYWCLSPFFASWLSSLQSTGTTEYRMTGSCEILQHFLRSSIPRSIWFAIVSSVPLLFRSRPKKDQWPRGNLSAYSLIVLEFFTHNSSFPFASHTMSLNIDRRWSSLWSSLVHTVIFSSYVSLRIATVVNPWKIFHSSYIGCPSIRFNSLKQSLSEYHWICFFQDSTGLSPIFPKQSTESEKT